MKSCAKPLRPQHKPSTPPLVTSALSPDPVAPVLDKAECEDLVQELVAAMRVVPYPMVPQSGVPGAQGAPMSGFPTTK